MAYTEVAVSGYNATPPPDDGSTGSDNQVTWAAIKTKLGDPLNTAIASINTNASSEFSSQGSRLDTLEGYSVTSTLYAPTGTVMLFRQTSAPTGWTKDTTNYNDHALRVTTGTPSVYASGTGVSTLFQASAYSTAATTLTTSQIPSHDHSFSDISTTSGSHTHTYTRYNQLRDNIQGGGAFDDGWFNTTTDTTSSHGGHTHSVSGTTGTAGTGGSHTHTVDLRLNYVDIIFATKD